MHIRGWMGVSIDNLELSYHKDTQHFSILYYKLIDSHTSAVRVLVISSSPIILVFAFKFILRQRILQCGLWITWTVFSTSMLQYPTMSNKGQRSVTHIWYHHRYPLIKQLTSHTEEMWEFIHIIHSLLWCNKTVSYLGISLYTSSTIWKEAQINLKRLSL